MTNIDGIQSGKPLEPAKTTQDATNKQVDEKNENVQLEKAQLKAQQDELTISDESRDIDRLNSQIAKESYFDESRVNALKEAINNNQYQVDANKLADNLFNQQINLLD